MAALIPTKYRHLYNRDVVALLTVPCWTSSMSFMYFAILHRDDRPNPESIEFYPVPGYTRIEENNISVANLIRPLPSLRVVEGEVVLGVRSKGAAVDVVPTFFVKKTLADISAEELMKILDGTENVLVKEIPRKNEKKVTVTIKRIELTKRDLAEIISTSVSLFRYKIYGQMPVLLVNNDSEKKGVVGFISQLATAYYLLNKNLVEKQVVECALLFEEFNLPVAVVTLENKCVEELLTQVTYSDLIGKMEWLLMWLNNLVSGEVGGSDAGAVL